MIIFGYSPTASLCLIVIFLLCGLPPLPFLNSFLYKVLSSGLLFFLDSLDANLNRGKLKTTLVPMSYPLSLHKPVGRISLHSQDGENQEIFHGTHSPTCEKHDTIMRLGSGDLAYQSMNYGIFGPSPPGPRQVVRLIC